MIRWSYVVPRLLLVAAVMLAIWAGLNPLTRWTLIVMGQSATSSKVEIARADTSLLRTEIRLSDFRVANPKSPMKNLVEADEVTLAFDPEALLQRKYVVREGRVSGLRFGTDRDSSGELDWEIDLSVGLPDVVVPGLDGLSEDSLDRAADLLAEELVAQAERLESVRLAKELYERWPVEYERMEARADSLRTRVERLRALSDRVRGGRLDDDPLRTLETFRLATAELRRIESEVLALRSEIDRLRRQVLDDKEAIVRAQRRDAETIRETLQLERVSADALSDYLLGPELSETVRTVARWVRWGREYLATRIDQPEPVRGRGVDVLFGDAAEQPGFLIRSLAIDGEARLAGRPVRFEGTAEGLTTEPKLYGRPLVLKARIDADTDLAVEAVLDRTGQTPHDRITIDCPGIELRERTLGNQGRLALRVSPGRTHVWASLDLAGDELSGRILVRQHPVELVPDLAAVPSGARIAQSLQTAMHEVREIRVVVDLAGTLDKPRWGLQSNLGPQLAAALSGVLERELEARREELLAHLRGQVEARLAEFDRIVASKREALLAKLELDRAEIGQLNQVIARRLRLPAGALGENLPADVLSRGLPGDVLRQGLPKGNPNRGLPEGLPFRF